ncbi:MAG: hypothetical protein MZV64_00410 [Ignavibacteriales bacterium]|nr:hypothetical protein [Ignavibacteriales bacterium]
MRRSVAFERRKYDFDVFNAEAVARYRDWDEAEFMAHFERTRQKMGADLRSMNEAVFENRRVRSWLHGIIHHHAREHLVALSRFLVVDMLANNWATYIEDFKRLDQEKQKEFLSRAGIRELSRSCGARDRLVGGGRAHHHGHHGQPGLHMAEHRRRCLQPLTGTENIPPGRMTTCFVIMKRCGLRCSN